MSSTSRARRRTTQLSVALAAGAIAIAVGYRQPATLSTSTSTWLLGAALFVGFLLGEQFLLNIEFRRQAHSLTLGGIPLVLGALLVPLPVVLAARVLGAGTALAIQRMRPEKTFFNLSMYGFEAAVDTAAIHALVGTRSGPDLGLAAVALLVTVAVDQLMSCAVLAVIRMHNGPLSRRDVAEVLVPAAVLATVTMSATFGIVLLAGAGVVGWVVVVVTAGSAIAMYRGFLVASRRHTKLETIHEFVTGSAGTASLTATTEDLLARVRTLLRAARAEVTVLDAETGVDQRAGAKATRFTSDESGFSAAVVEQAALDWTAMRAVTDNESLVVPRTTRDRALRKWLTERGYRDAMVAPLPGAAGLGGVITVTDRMGDLASFTDDDLRLLQTLTSHFAVAGERAQMVERLAYDATHDTLTGLANRARLTRSILETPIGDGTRTAVLLLDLDEFKEVNDSLGHGAGDQLLQVVADRFAAALPADAVAARLGGDEFAACFSLAADDAASAVCIAEQIVAALAEPIVIDEVVLAAAASIGIATSVDPALSKDLLRHADTAMYAAKRGDDRVAVYDARMERDRTEKLALLADLRTTLQEHPERIAVYFQPQIDLASRSVCSAEALVRWHHPTLGVVSPDRFIPLAETAGLIDQFTPLILDAALHECRAWAESGRDIGVAVNLSARNVGDPRLPQQVAAALRRAGVPSSSLTIEITESSVIADPAQTLSVLARLAAQGVRISLDDFGTGYSSLSYLQRLPVQEVKIDRSFVFGLAQQEDARNSRALISAITSLCRSLDLHVVAEGAELAEMLDELRVLGCDVAQGYVIARPLSAPDFARWLDESAFAGSPRPRLLDDRASA